jgi:hypothetical protein
MSIGRRLFNMARSELNSLLDRAAEAERRASTSRDPDEDLYRRFSLDELSDQELEAEIELRYRARQAAKAGTAKAQAGRSQARPANSGQARKPAPPDELHLAYAALEVPYGADFAIVRKSYRALMRKYHPDRHTGSAEKQKAATELAQKLAQAYELIEKHTRR